MSEGGVLYRGRGVVVDAIIVATGKVMGGVGLLDWALGADF
jgi:hypothetical protein